MAQKASKFFNPKYKEEIPKCKEFLMIFEDSSIEADPLHGQKKYMIQMQKIANGKGKTIEICYEDLESYFKQESESNFLGDIRKNTKRYISLFSEAAEQVFPPRTVPLTLEEEMENFDELINQQRNQNFMSLDSNANAANPHLKVHHLLTRKFELCIIDGPQTKQNIMSIRNLKSNKIGSMVTIKAIVVRVSDVKPMITVATYVCDACGFEIYQTVTNKIYTPLIECTSQICQTNQTKGKLIPQTANSKFIPYQEVKIQETADQTPAGNIPKTFNVIAKGENTRMCSPGDIVIIQGVFLPTQMDTWLGAMSIVNNTYIEATKIIREKKKYIELVIGEETTKKIENLHNSVNTFELYSRLARSISPEIYGLEDVKKALLLMMVGGNTMSMKDGMKIRGDINIALIGDPGVAKSQLLKQIANISPRGIYTTGKGSSGVGLTAAVVRDPISNEISLEGGALVLADMGVCCIDEFDKMSDHDKTAIHEVMEQQTVSIAKAGITTTLNARTSVLAAANPLYGRYNKKITPHQNINLPAALLSRFDLIFLLLDKPDTNADQMLAMHVGYVHKHNKHPINNEFELFEPNFLRAFISYAKQFKPSINHHLHEFIVQRYVEKRKECTLSSKAGYVYTTPRTLLGLIRLSQAMAKLRFSHEVDQNDVDEALRLMEKSQISINESEEDERAMKQKTDNISAIFNIIKESCKNQRKECKYSDLEKRVLAKGFIQDDLQKCLRQYSSLNVIMVSENKTTITLI